MNVEKLKRLQAQVRIGGKGTPRRKKKVIHQTAVTDDKKLQSSLKKLSVSTIPGIEEVNIIKDDLTVIHFNNPKAQASLSANTFAVTGHGETKKIVEMLPEILPQLGQETVVQLRMFANSMSGAGQSKAGAAANVAQITGDNLLSSVMEEDDDVPLLVSDFDEVAKLEAASSPTTSKLVGEPTELPLEKKEGDKVDAATKNIVLVADPPVIYENSAGAVAKDKNKDVKKNKKQDKVEEKPKKDVPNIKQPPIEKIKQAETKKSNEKVPDKPEAKETNLKAKDSKDAPKESKQIKVASKEQADKQVKKSEEKQKLQMKAEKQTGKETKTSPKQTDAKEEKRGDEIKQIADAITTNVGAGEVSGKSNKQQNKKQNQQKQQQTAVLDKNKQSDLQKASVIEEAINKQEKSLEPPKTAEILIKQTMETPKKLDAANKIESALKDDAEKIRQPMEKIVNVEANKALELKNEPVVQKDQTKEVLIEPIVVQDQILPKIENETQKPKREEKKSDQIPPKQYKDAKQEGSPITKKIVMDANNKVEQTAPATSAPKDTQNQAQEKTTKKSKKDTKKETKKELPSNETLPTEVIKKESKPYAALIEPAQKEPEAGPIKTDEQLPTKPKEVVKIEDKEPQPIIPVPAIPELVKQETLGEKNVAAIPLPPPAQLENKDVPIVTQPQSTVETVKDAVKITDPPLESIAKPDPSVTPKEIAVEVKVPEVKDPSTLSKKQILDPVTVSTPQKAPEKSEELLVTSPLTTTTIVEKPITAPSADATMELKDKETKIEKPVTSSQPTVAEPLAETPVNILPPTAATPSVPILEPTPTVPSESHIIEPSKIEASKPENKTMNVEPLSTQKKSGSAKQPPAKKSAVPPEQVSKQQQQQTPKATPALKPESKKPDNTKAKQSSPAKASPAPAAKTTVKSPATPTKSPEKVAPAATTAKTPAKKSNEPVVQEGPKKTTTSSQDPVAGKTKQATPQNKQNKTTTPTASAKQQEGTASTTPKTN